MANLTSADYLMLGLSPVLTGFAKKIEELEKEVERLKSVQLPTGPLKTFTCFKKLPIELRLKIWKMGCMVPEIQNIDIRYKLFRTERSWLHSCYTYLASSSSIWKASLLRVNKESQKVAQSFVFSSGPFGDAQLNPEVDIVRLVGYSSAFAIYVKGDEEIPITVKRLAVSMAGVLGDNNHIRGRAQPTTRALEAGLKELTSFQPRELILTVGDDFMFGDVDLIKPRHPPPQLLEVEVINSITGLAGQEQAGFPDTWEACEKAISNEFESKMALLNAYLEGKDPYIDDAYFDEDEYRKLCDYDGWGVPVVKFLETVKREAA